MVNYSKWDNLQLSDDSDIKVHPNVDKRSFIRAKQNQIHMEREQEKREVEAIKYDQIINNNLALRISALLSNLKLNPQPDAKDAGSVVFQAVIKTAPPSAKDDQPPPRPKGVFKNEQSPPTYSRMMASLLDEVNKSLNKQAVHPDRRFEALVHELEGHLQKIQDLQKDLSARLDSIEKQTATKITSESYHVGFDRSIISKDKSNEEVSKSSPKVELLNPGFEQGSSFGSASPGAEAPGSGPDDEKKPTASPVAKGFAHIPPLDYRASHAYISTHPEILKESETDGLLIEALDAAVAGNSSGTWQLTHQALLLQYCRLLGRDGVGIFFKRMATPDHQAKQLFHQDVKEKVQRLHEIAAKQRADESEGGLEQIQIQAANPGTTIHIRVPEIDANDEEGKKTRAIFDQFPREMRDALESGSLDNVNKVLGTMDVSEAEDLVALLGEAGCLDIDQDIIDTTTEEGRRQLSQIQGAAEDELGGGANEVD